MYSPPRIESWYWLRISLHLNKAQPRCTCKQINERRIRPSLSFFHICVRKPLFRHLMFFDANTRQLLSSLLPIIALAWYIILWVISLIGCVAASVHSRISSQLPSLTLVPKADSVQGRTRRKYPRSRRRAGCDYNKTTQRSRRQPIRKLGVHL